jgi:hypothetical protein
MIVDAGKHVKCVFKNGTVIEGIVIDWLVGQVQLQSLNDESIMIITHPEEDIMLIKILADKPSEKIESSALQEEIKEKLEEAHSQEDSELQDKTITELKQLVRSQEKQIIANKIKEHFPSAYVPHKPNYGFQIDLLPRSRKKS